MLCSALEMFYAGFLKKSYNELHGGRGLAAKNPILYTFLEKKHTMNGTADVV